MLVCNQHSYSKLENNWAKDLYCAHINGPGSLNRLVTDPRLHKRMVGDIYVYMRLIA
jgi:hypothetical protein